MSRVFVCGLGAVSPAGWSVAGHARGAGKGASRCPCSRSNARDGRSRSGRGWFRPRRRRLPFLAHPRLRRTSPITHYAAAAALEAVARLRANNERTRRLGVVVCLQSGCVQYSYRFFDETLKDPATASPLLFPETVFAAPASHVAALLENTPLVYTLTGDPACFLQGMALGVEWLEEQRVDACLVIGAEENQLAPGRRALALRASGHYQRRSRGGVPELGCRQCRWGLNWTPSPMPTPTPARMNRANAARRMREQLPPGAPAELLCDGLERQPASGRRRTGRLVRLDGLARQPETIILGEGLMAAGAWQCVAACDGVATGQFPAATVSLVGSNQQAIGARFVRADPGISHLSADMQRSSIRP